MNNWVMDRVRTTARRRLVLWTLALLAVFSLFGMQGRYFYNFAFGPFPASFETLAGIDRIEDFATPFVQVQGDDVVETGLQEVKVRSRRGRETGREVSANYYALAMGDRLLIVKSNHGGKSFEGELAPIPARIANEMFSAPEMAAVRGVFYPFYLDASDYRSAGYFGLGALAIFLFFFIRAALPAWRHMSNPATAPVSLRVGEWGHVAMLSPILEQEFRSSSKKLGGWAFGETYLIRSGWLSFDVLRFEDLIWAYKHVTRRTVFFIPVGKIVAARLHFIDGEARISGSEKKLDEALGDIHERAPWALYGFDQDLQVAFKKRFDEVVRNVQERRRLWEARVVEQEATASA